MTTEHQHKHGMSLAAKLALGGAAITAGIIVAPYMLPAIGIGSEVIAQDALSILHTQTVGGGLAGALGEAISQIPLIGRELAKGGFFNIAATAATGLGGLLVGNWMSKNHEGKSGIDWGKVIKWAGLATSALISLPSILTGITNGLLYLASEYLSPASATILGNKVLETVGYLPYPDMFKSGLAGAAATLPHLLTCGSSIAPLLATIGLDIATEKESSYVALDTKGKPLPSEDKNHHISKEEQKLVDDYNHATPAKKIMLQRKILAQGYNPDFHTDGTVHLFKHTHAPHRGMGLG